MEYPTKKNSGSRKRAAVDSEGQRSSSSSQFRETTTSPAMRRSFRRFAPVETPFQRRCRELRKREFLQLNSDFRQYLKDLKRPLEPPTDPDHPDLFQVERAAASYRVMASDITRRLGGDTAGDVASFGKNDTNQLGFDNKGHDSFKPTIIPPLTRRNIRMVDCGGMHSVALSRDGVPWTWGSNDFGK